DGTEEPDQQIVVNEHVCEREAPGHYEQGPPIRMPKHDVNVEQREEVDQILLVNTPSGKEENCRDEEQCLRHALRRIPNEPPTGNPPGNDATRNPQIPHDEIESVYCGEGRDDLRRLENVDIGHAAPAAVACRLRHGRESEGVPS